MSFENHVFIIAEIGSNHNQDINRAFKLMKIAKDAGADAVKFQSIRVDKLIDQNEITSEDEILFSKIKLEENWYEKIFSYAKEIDIEVISAPTYIESIPLLINSGVRYMKIASPQTYGYPRLVKEVAMANMLTFMSTGYCQMSEIERAIELFNKYGKKENLILLHCVSEYPTNPVNARLSYIRELNDRFGLKVGYSDHTLGNIAAYSAVAMGAKVIEKHITISRNEVGPDHFFAAEPAEFAEMVNNIRLIEVMLGEGEKELTEFEKNFRNSVVMHPYSNRDLHEGDILKEEDIDYYRSKTGGISPWTVEDNLVNHTVKRKIVRGMKIDSSFVY